MEDKLPKRKHPRLKGFDYSSNGAYFITICTENRRCVLSRIVGRGLAPAEVEYTEYGKIVDQQLLLLEERYEDAKIGPYVIMPNHIHLILNLSRSETAGASPRPTVMDIVCTFKSIATRECRHRGLATRLFQRSFHDHIIRDRNDYEEIYRYIYENPLAWEKDELYSEE